MEDTKSFECSSKGADEIIDLTGETVECLTIDRPTNERELLFHPEITMSEKETSFHSEHSKDDFILSLIEKNIYINKPYKHKEKDTSSLSSLVDIPLTQSDCIKLGFAIESMIIDIAIGCNPSLMSMKKKNIKGVKQKDILLYCKRTNRIFYDEVKCNIALDTEKSVATIQKVKSVEEELVRENPSATVISGLVCARYLSKDDIPSNLRSKYKSIDSKLFGINDFLELIGCSVMCFENEIKYKDFVNHIAHKLLQV